MWATCRALYAGDLFRASLIAVCLIASLAACEARLSLGSGCVRTSECTPPHACIASRCREECDDHRDCPIATRCLIGSDGLGVCSLEERCDLSSPCGEDLVCSAAACFDACPGGSCPAGGRCVAGLCEREGASVDAGVPSTDAPGAGRITCTRDSDCGTGARCTRLLGGAFVCRPGCATVGDCALGDSSVGCANLEWVGGGNAAACTLPCDVFRSPNGCVDGESCDLLEFSTPSGVNAAALECRPIDPAMGGQDEPCSDGPGSWDPALCARGVTCDGVSPNFTCQALCTVGGAFGPPCPTGTVCEAFSVDARFAGARLGSCDPI